MSRYECVHGCVCVCVYECTQISTVSRNHRYYASLTGTQRNAGMDIYLRIVLLETTANGEKFRQSEIISDPAVVSA